MKHSNKKLVTVRGFGPFPIDMLRYDGAFPAHETDSGLIVQSFRGMGSAQTRVQIYTDGAPTVDRWQSFAWEVISVESA